MFERTAGWQRPVQHHLIKYFQYKEKHHKSESAISHSFFCGGAIDIEMIVRITTATNRLKGPELQ